MHQSSDRVQRFGVAMAWVAVLLLGMHRVEPVLFPIIKPVPTINCERDICPRVYSGEMSYWWAMFVYGCTCNEQSDGVAQSACKR